MEQAHIDKIITNLLNKDNGNIDILNSYNNSEIEFCGESNYNTSAIEYIKDTLITDKNKLTDLIKNKRISNDELIKSLKLIQKNDNNSLAVYCPKWFKKDPESRMDFSGTLLCFSPEQQLGEALVKETHGKVQLINRSTEITNDDCEVIAEKVRYYEDSILSVVIDNSDLELPDKSEHVFIILEKLIKKIYILIKMFWSLKNIKSINITYIYSTKRNDMDILLNCISGLFRNLCIENSKVHCKTVDIGNIKGINNVASIIEQEFCSMGDYFEVSYRNGYREVNAIERTLPNYTTGNIVKQDGCYVIIGGLGKIGLLIAKHLVCCGASKVVLIGRRDTTKEENDIINSYNREKETVIYRKCNILQAAQISKLLNMLNKQYGMIHGIYHTAGIIIDSLAINKEQENVIKVLEPKIKGTMNIVNAAKKLKAGFVMLFSSLAAVTGNMGQSDYGFANAFLDMYAENDIINGSDTHIYSINWPLWEEGGMQVQDDRIQLMINSTGMVPLLTSTALLIIDTIIDNKIPRSIILFGKNNKITNMLQPLCYKENESGDLHTNFNYEVQNDCEINVNTVESDNDVDIYHAVRDYISKALIEVAEIDMQTLDEDSSFNEFGLDSIMIERLNNYFENDSLNLPKTILYEKNTQRDLSNYIIENHRAFVDEKLRKRCYETHESSDKLVNDETFGTNDSYHEDGYRSIWNYLVNILCKVAEVDKNSIEDDITFTELGLDSIMVEKIHSCFEKDGIILPNTIMYERNSLMELSNYILENHIDSVKSLINVKKTSVKPAPIEVKETKITEPLFIHSNSEEKKEQDDIAVIGVDLRVAGAENVGEFWNNIINKKTSINEVPNNKWDHKKIFSPDINDTIFGKAYCNYGAFLEKSDCFDAMFFNISPKEAEIMDPQERILLESVWRLLEDSGYTRDELSRKYKNSNQPGVGVFIGATNHSYALSAVNEWNSGNYTIPSSWQWAFANRISHIFDFTGPSVPVDTGCSASMTALHLACKSIENGESSIAVVGGVNLYSHPTSYIGACKLKLLSANSEYTFLGEDSDGFIPGEGVATILLKPLEKAKRDNDKIYGVIKGTAINHSGHTNTFFAPSSDLQEQIIEKVGRKANVDLNTIDYIEMGTTGSAIGDPTEFRALCNAFKKSRVSKNSCAIGSVKSFIGHLESASGIVAVIKSLLQFKNNRIAPTLLANKINPEINIENSPFHVSTETSSFENNNNSRRALINSISAGGSYACAILEDYPVHTDLKHYNDNSKSYIINISAKSELALKAYLNKFSIWIEENPEVSLHDVSMTLKLKRENFACKTAFVCNSVMELKKQIRIYLDEGKLIDGVYDNRDIKLNSFDKSIYSGKAGKVFITAIYQEHDMKKLAYLWTIGANINWNELYENKSQFNKIDLPCYQFERERYWITEETEKNGDKQNSLTSISSMLDVNVSTLGNVCFSKLFTGEEFYLKDHLGILPAVAYIEMIYQAAICSISGQNKLSIKNLVLVRPFVVREEKRVLKVRFTTQADMICAQVFSSTPSEIVYAQCNIILGKQVGISNVKVNIEELICEMTGGENEALGYYNHLDKLNSCFGYRFKGIKKFYFRENEAFTEAGIIDSLVKTKNDFNYHPTLLDAGFQSVVALAYAMGANPDTIFMPFVTENIEFFERRETAFIKYIHVIAIPGKAKNPSEWKYTVEYFSEDHNILIRISNYSILAVNHDIGSNVVTNDEILMDNSSGDKENIDSEDKNIIETITNICMQTLKLRKEIDLDTSLLEYGFDSITFTELSNAINNKLRIDTNPVLFFEKNTVNSIAEHILQNYIHVKETYVKKHEIKGSEVPLSYNFESILSSINNTDHFNEDSDRYAIIGMSGVFPGGSDIEEFWDNIQQGKDLITDIPSNRWNWKEYDGKSTYGEYNIYAHSGGFIQDVDCFDAKFFKVSPLDASIMDPQQRLILEHTWKAMEDAGYSSNDLKGTDTSIFIGVSNADYGELLVQRKIPTVLTHSMITNRVSFMLETTGKSEPCDSACSSSLLAIHRAIETIKNGESKMAFAGGVNLILSPNTYVYECLSQALSPTGTCKTFDESADGYTRGEGVGVILIKGLQDAIADGDSIYATICGSAVQHAGKSTGLTVPNADSQASVIEKAYDNAGIDINTVTYIEVHGTGTKIGDPIEINGLKKAFADLSVGSKYTTEPNTCALSSVKTNIGHLEAASGIASVIKVVKSLENKIIAPTVHFKTLNPFIDLNNSPFYINSQPTEYIPYYNKEDNTYLPRRAGISSFGIGGVNAHIVLEEFKNEKVELVKSKSQNCFIFPVSAQNMQRLVAYLELILKLLKELKTGIDTQDNIILQRICYTFQTGRDAFNCRCAIKASSLSELEYVINEVLKDQDDDNYVICENISKYTSWRKEKCQNTSEMDLINDLIEENDYNELIKMWCCGININWNQLYFLEKPQKMHLPTYPFKKDRYWIPDYYSDLSNSSKRSFELVRQKDNSTEPQLSAKFSEKDDFLKDHIVNGKMILPGAAYSEMIFEAACTLESEEFNCIKDMFWLSNFEAGEEPIDLTILVNKNDKLNEISICSDKLLVKGTVLKDSTTYEEQDLAAYIDACEVPLKRTLVYQQFEQNNMKFGKSFQTINAMWCADDYSVVQYAIEENEKVQRYILNPRILDAAFQSIVGNKSAEFSNHEIRVPFYMKKLTIVKSPEDKGFILAKKKDSGSNSDNYDIYIMDLNGNLNIVIEEYVVRKLLQFN